MKYSCPEADIRGARDAIRCRVSGTVCAHQKMCLMEGRIVLTASAMKCPGREENSNSWKFERGTGQDDKGHE